MKRIPKRQLHRLRLRMLADWRKYHARRCDRGPARNFIETTPGHMRIVLSETIHQLSDKGLIAKEVSLFKTRATGQSTSMAFTFFDAFQEGIGR